MKVAQLLLLAGFAACGVITAVGLVRCGMIAGQSQPHPEQAESDEGAQAWRKRSRRSAIGAVVCLAGAMLLGALFMR